MLFKSYHILNTELSGRRCLCLEQHPASFVAVFRSRLKTHLFHISYPTLSGCTVPAQ